MKATKERKEQFTYQPPSQSSSFGQQCKIPASPFNPNPSQLRPGVPAPKGIPRTWFRRHCDSADAACRAAGFLYRHSFSRHQQHWIHYRWAGLCVPTACHYGCGAARCSAAVISRSFWSLDASIFRILTPKLRIDANVEEMEVNISGAQQELLRYFTSISSNRWLIMKVFGLVVMFLFLFAALR